jgi:hypothetical protein
MISDHATIYLLYQKSAIYTNNIQKSSYIVYLEHGWGFNKCMVGRAVQKQNIPKLKEQQQQHIQQQQKHNHNNGLNEYGKKRCSLILMQLKEQEADEPR